MRMLVPLSLLALALAAVASSAAPPARTLVQARGPIVAVAQDGGRLAWQSIERSNRECPFLVRIRTLAARTQRAVVKAGGDTCNSDTGFGTGFGEAREPYLTLAGDRAVWMLRDSGNSQYIRIQRGALSAARDRQVDEELVWENVLDQHFAFSGDGDTVVFGYSLTGNEDTEECFDNGVCKYVAMGGGVFRIAGLKLVKVPGAPPAITVSLSGSRVALLTPGRIGQKAVRPKLARAVEVRSVVTGKRLGRFTAPARVKALAIAGTVVAVLTPAKLLRYNVAGKLLGSTTVHPAAAPELSASTFGIVYRFGNSIRVVPTLGGPLAYVALAKSTPLSLSIEGRRVVWAENRTVGGLRRGRIQAVTLP